jgi:hypothetical protein
LQEDPQSDPQEVKRAAEALLLLARFQRELPREARSA